MLCVPFVFNYGATVICKSVVWQSAVQKTEIRPHSNIQIISVWDPRSSKNIVITELQVSLGSLARNMSPTIQIQ